MNLEKYSLNNYLVSHNSKKIEKLYIIILCFIILIFLNIMIFYRYDKEEKIIAKKEDNNLTFNINSNQLLKLNNYELYIDNEKQSYKIINLDMQNSSNYKVTINVTKNVETYCILTFKRKNITLLTEIKEQIKEMQ